MTTTHEVWGPTVSSELSSNGLQKARTVAIFPGGAKGTRTPGVSLAKRLIRPSLPRFPLRELTSESAKRRGRLPSVVDRVNTRSGDDRPTEKLQRSTAEVLQKRPSGEAFRTSAAPRSAATTQTAGVDDDGGALRDTGPGRGQAQWLFKR